MLNPISWNQNYLYRYFWQKRNLFLTQIIAVIYICNYKWPASFRPFPGNGILMRALHKLNQMHLVRIACGWLILPRVEKSNITLEQSYHYFANLIIFFKIRNTNTPNNQLFKTCHRISMMYVSPLWKKDAIRDPQLLLMRALLSHHLNM